MKKEKLAFVVVRYGSTINGGAEYHCRMLAERLTNDYDVEVLTTCVQNYVTGESAFPEGIEMLNGVTIRRFATTPYEPQTERRYGKQAKTARRLRMFLYRTGLLKPLSYIVPVWKCSAKKEELSLCHSVFYSPKMNEYIRDHKAEYKAFVVMSIDYAPFYYTALYAGEKTIAIPTMHCAKVSFKSIHTHSFSRFGYVGFNTEAEMKLAQDTFGKALGRHGIISVGIELPQAASWNETKEKYNLPDEYLLYVGRIDPGKLGKVFQYFTAYKKEYPTSSLKLVCVGGMNYEKELLYNSDIIYTGFVSDEEKMAILQHATVTVNPSLYESLSLILLEALSQGKPMLVNGHCEVLKEHCQPSSYAADYYMNEHQFVEKLHRLVTSPELREERAEAGRKYVEENYNWELIMSRLKDAINLFPDVES